MIEPTNLFDPVLYRSQRKPLPEALGLPGWCYTSETFYRKEVDEIFLKTWLFIGHAAEIPTSGEYLCIDTPGGPVIVIRDQNATVRAFANTCRHRGARLLEGSGRCERAIVCPYHGWTYAFDGTLKGAPAMDKTAGFEPAKYGLKPIKLSQWQDLMWINFDPHAPSLETYLGSMISDYSDYHFSDMVVTRRARYELACNWKLVTDIASEDYHTGTVHRTSVGTQLAYELPDTHENWQCLRLPRATSIGVLPGEETVFPHIAHLPPALEQGTNFLLVHPNTCLGCVQDCMWWVSFMPLGPDRCINHVGFCFPRATVERADFEEVAARYYHRWDLSIDEDNEAGEIQQQGLESLLFQPGPYSYREPLVYRFARWVLARVIND